MRVRTLIALGIGGLVLSGCAMMMDTMQSTQYQAVEPAKATILQEGEAKHYCENCGMNLPKYYKANHAIRFADGKAVQFCSIHCLVEEVEFTKYKGLKESIKEYWVVDNNTLAFIDATKAYYVVGSSKPATMGMVSKYAFGTQEGAGRFAREFGGEVVDFAKVYETTKSDYAKEIAYVHSMKTSRAYKMGQMLYDTKCDKGLIDSLHVNTIGELKMGLRTSKACEGEPTDMQLQAISIYVWDIKMDKFAQTYGNNEAVQEAIKQP